MNQPNPNSTLNDPAYYTHSTANLSKPPINDSKSNTQQINPNLYHPTYYNYTPPHLYSGSPYELMNRNAAAPPSIPPPPLVSDPSISVHLAQELRELGHQLGLTEEDLATLPSSPSLRSATNPNTKLFDESEQRFFDNFLDNIFFDENLFTDNPLPPTLENPTYFTPGPSLSSSSTSHMFTLEKPQHKSAVHSALYDMFKQHSKEPSMHSAPTTPSSLFLSHEPGASNENNSRRTLTPNHNPASIESPNIHTRGSMTPSSSYTNNIGINSPTIPAKRKGSHPRSQKAPSKISPTKAEKANRRSSKELEYESSLNSNSEVKKEESAQNSESPTPNSFDDKKDNMSKSDRLRKGNKELLTEEEKRANHIASEQKRRNMIRSGFRDLTEIVPALRDMNNSKSTILFKAVDFIKRLERKNQRLKNKANTLQRRLEDAQTATMYSLHNGHHQPPPSGHGGGGGGGNTGSGGQGYMYAFSYENNQSLEGGNGNYFDGRTSGDSNQYSLRAEPLNSNGMVNCRVNTPSIISVQGPMTVTSRWPTASRS
ncbi:hypothetical protein K7432_010839 [Basidiobolus ranarum]|uniref:BHLH domain-containing protein n=1 Tax=Basidiobolus ranarum TaxID=34480 RepID=A0ABR2VVC9_9FUNG